MTQRAALVAAWRDAEAADGVPETFRSFRRDAPSPRARVLLLHGAGGSPADFHFLSTDLARHGVSTLCPLLPGHGRGEAGLPALRFDRLVGRALDAYDAFAAEGGAVSLLGQSVGAVLGAHVAVERRPERFVALAPALRPFILRRVGALVLGLVVRPRLAADTLRWQTDVRRGIRATVPRLGEVRCPLLVLHSRDDGSVAARGAQEFLDRAGSDRKRIVWLEGQGHVLSTAPERERVFGPVREFLSAPTAGDRSGT